MSYQDVMDMPLRGFWSFNSSVGRLRAEEALSQMELFMLGGMVTGDYVQQMRTRFLEDMKTPMVAQEVMPDDAANAKVHTTGFNQLKGIAAKLQR